MEGGDDSGHGSDSLVRAVLGLDRKVVTHQSSEIQKPAYRDVKGRVGDIQDS